MKKFNFDRMIRPNVPHSVFNMSYDKKFSCSPGELIPCYEQEVYPGDSIAYKMAMLVKSLPLVTPAMIDIFAYTHFWFVPYRILQSYETMEKGLDTNTFEDYINGVKEGLTIPYLLNSQGFYNISQCKTAEVTEGKFSYVYSPAKSGSPRSLYSLLDYFGIVGNKSAYPNELKLDSVVAFPIRAYNAIWNTKYRDENIQTEDIGLNKGVTVGVSLNNSNILRRNWEKDYFTSMLPWQQKGTPIALPVTSSLQTTLDTPVFGDLAIEANTSNGAVHYIDNDDPSPSGYLKANVISTAFDINDLRLSNSVQKFLEVNARGGTKYHEFCISHFGCAVRDERLNEPMYLGGSKTPIMITEVTQTSSSTLDGSTPQGTLTGKADTADSKFIFKEKFLEHGIVIGLFSLMPKPIYSGGTNRMWIKQDVYDWYSPEFAHLGEQPIYNEELNAVPSTENPLKVLGFQGRWSEMRTRQNVCTSDFTVGTAASTGSYGGLKDWTYQRTAQDFTLNSSFLVCHPKMDIFAFPNSKNFLVDFGNIVKMNRPIPALAEPALVG